MKLDNFSVLLKAAETAKNNDDPKLSISNYLKALRIITPDDSKIEFAIIAREMGAQIKVEMPEIDMIDSSIRSELVSLYRTIGKPNEALHHAQIALYLDRVVRGESHNNTSASYHDMALVHLDLGEPNAAMTYFAKSKSIDEEKFIIDAAPKEVAWREIMRGSLFADYGYVEQAARYASLSLDRLHKLFTGDPIMLLRAYDRCCQHLQNIGEHAIARIYYEKALNMARSAKIPLKLHIVLLANNTLLLEEQGDFATAMQLAKELETLSKSHSRYRISIQRKLELFDIWRNRLASILNQGTDNLHDIFISYSTQQENLVKCLHHELINRGIDCWMFKQADDWMAERPNQEVLDLSRSEIDHSAMMLSIGTSTSITSKFVADEIEYATTSGLPVLIWYPEGVRLQPVIRTTWAAASQEELKAFTFRLSREGVYSYFGYGLRKNEISVVADAITKRFSMIYKDHKINSRALGRNVRNALDPTRLWPVVVDSEGTPLVQELLLAGTVSNSSWKRHLQRHQTQKHSKGT